MAFMPLVIAGGMAQAYNEEVAAKKEQVRQLNNVKREYLFKTGMSKLEARRAAVKESRARISQATTLGFDKKAAAVLEASGELTTIISRLEKLRDDPEKDVSKAGIKKMSSAILDNVPEDRVAAAMKYAFDSGAVEGFNAEKLIDVIFSTTNVEESLQEGFNMVADIPSGRGPGVAPTGVSLVGLTDLSPEKTQKVRNLIEDRLKDSLGRTLDPNTGAYQWENPSAANAIIEKSLNYYLEQRADPFREADLADITTEISDTVQDLLGTGAQLDDIASGFEFGKPFTPKGITVPTEGPGSLLPPGAQVDDNGDIFSKNNLATQ